MEFASGTRLQLGNMPFGNYVGGYALCSDGIVRKLKRIAPADTFFSMPASVSVKGRTVAGYVTIETLDGSSVESENDPAVVKFIAYQYRKNANFLPRGAYRRKLVCTRSLGHVLCSLALWQEMSEVFAP